MCSDLYVSEVDSDVFGDLFIEMTRSGSLMFTACDPGSNDHAVFTLPSSLEGRREVERIVLALQEWMRHTQDHDTCTG